MAEDSMVVQAGSAPLAAAVSTEEGSVEADSTAEAEADSEEVVTGNRDIP